VRRKLWVIRIASNTYHTSAKGKRIHGGESIFQKIENVKKDQRLAKQHERKAGGE
jgi:hypothetical protein